MRKMMCCMCGCKKHAGIFLSSFDLPNRAFFDGSVKGIMGQIVHPHPSEALK